MTALRRPTPLDRVLGPDLLWPVVVVVGSLVGVGAVLDPLLAVMVVAGTGAAALVLAKPAVGGYLLVALVPPLASIRRGFPLPGFRLAELLVLSISALVLLFPERHPPKWRKVEWAALLWVLATLALAGGNLVLRGQSSDGEALGKVLAPIQFFMLYRAVVVSLNTQERRNTALRWALLGSIPVGIVALLQVLNVGPVRQLIIDWTGSTSVQSIAFSRVPRATGPFAHWHSLGGYLVIVVALTVALLARPDTGSKVLGKLALRTVLLVASLALVATVTLVAILGGVAVVILVAHRAGITAKVVLGMVAVGLLAALVLGPNLTRRLDSQFNQENSARVAGPSFLPQTVGFRIAVWTDQYVPVIRKHIIAGYGPALPPEITWRHTESIYVALLLRGGLPLLAVYGILWAAFWGDARRVDRSSKPGAPRAPALALSALLVVVLGQQLVHPYFVDAGFPQLFWGLVGVVSGALAWSEA